MSQPADAEFAAFVNASGQRLLRTAYLLSGDWGHAEDLVQTALAKTWLRWSRLRDTAGAEPYARRVLATTHSKWWRRRWRGETPTETLPDAAVTTSAYDAVHDRAALTLALRELTPRQRAVVVLRYYDDLPEADVARTLGCSVGTVKSTASRALERLRHLHLVDPPASASTLAPQPLWEHQS